MITRDKAWEFVQENMQNQNLRRHCLAVEAVMKSLAKHFNENEEMWGIAGLLHDADYELIKNTPKEHLKKTVEWLKENGGDKTIINAVVAHGWGYVDWAPKPKNKMEWSIYCCDELTGFIIAVALVKGKILANVDVDSVLKKFPAKAFAAAVNREQIKMCENELGIPLNKFVDITLSAMKEIHQALGL